MLDLRIGRIGEDLTSRLDNKIEVLEMLKSLRRKDYINSGIMPFTTIGEDLIDEALYV